MLRLRNHRVNHTSKKELNVTYLHVNLYGEERSIHEWCFEKYKHLSVYLDMLLQIPQTAFSACDTVGIKGLHTKNWLKQ